MGRGGGTSKLDTPYSTQLRFNPFSHRLNFSQPFCNLLVNVVSRKSTPCANGSQTGRIMEIIHSLSSLRECLVNQILTTASVFKGLNGSLIHVHIRIHLFPLRSCAMIYSIEETRGSTNN